MVRVGRKPLDFPKTDSAFRLARASEHPQQIADVEVVAGRLLRSPGHQRLEHALQVVWVAVGTQGHSAILPGESPVAVQSPA
jgi:hypothetical protein